MVELEEKVISEVIRGSSCLLITEEGLRIGMESNRLDMDFKGGTVQIASGNYGSSHPVCLAVFYNERRIYPII